MARTTSTLLATLTILVLTACSPAGPVIGFNIWDTKPHAEDPQRVVREVEAMHAAGFRRVALIPFVYADLTSGRVRQVWPGDTFASMTDAELSAAIRRAKQLGMTANVTPFVEPRNRSVGRNMIAFTPATLAGRVFWADYREAVVGYAKLAKAAGADEFNVGSELVGMDYDRANAGEWTKLIDAAAGAFGGDVGYTTQHWTFDQPATVDMIWRHPKINAVSLSAYLDHQPEHGHPGLATPADCRGKASDGPAFVDLVTRNFDAFYAKRIKPVADAVKKPVRIGEFGIPPYDTATLAPYRWDWPANTGYDAEEAANVWRGVLAAIDKRPEIRSIDAWIWAWPGGFRDDSFGLRPGLTDARPGDGFDESQNNAAWGVLRSAALKEEHR